MPGKRCNMESECLENAKKIVKLQEAVASAHHRIDDEKKERMRQDGKIEGLEKMTTQLEGILTRLEKTVDRLVASIDKAKGYLITGVLVPILLLVILTVLKLK